MADDARFPPERIRAEHPTAGPSAPGSLLDVLNVAAVVLDAKGRIVFWSPQAEQLFGYTAQEALGEYAARLLVAEEHFALVLDLFQQVMTTGESWAGVFPVRHKDGSTRLLEFRNMRLLDDLGDVYALGLASDQSTLRAVERNLALSVRLVEQSPIGVAVLDTDLRYAAVNPALARINGLSAEEHLGRTTREILPGINADAAEQMMRRVLETGQPVLDWELVGRRLADPENDHAWSVSLYRLEDARGRVLGIAASVIDVTDRYRARAEADQARHRLAVIADASARIGTTLDLDKTAAELADLIVPDLADIATVDVLHDVLDTSSSDPTENPALMRSVATAAADPALARAVTDALGAHRRYTADQFVTCCVTSATPVRLQTLAPGDLRRITPDGPTADRLRAAGVHSYLAVPLSARDQVLGAIELFRARNEHPFTADDALLACELASRAAVCIDNARWYRRQRDIALTLQRSMLPRPPDRLVGLEVATHYRPAGMVSEVGGDWFDTIALRDGRTVLVVGDVMGSGINAATTMGRLRTATQTLARLALDPADILVHLDEITAELDPYIATCVCAVYDPHQAQIRIASAGHLPPILIRPGARAHPLHLPAGTPLGVGEAAFAATTVSLDPGDRLVLYTDGLIETRHDDIDLRLAALLDLLQSKDEPLQATCERLLALRHPDERDDVALLLARALPPSGQPRT
ncbi:MULTISPECIES: SpoIIE family protein phosphatase [unclassified Streptomyces]|uniref:SpoIIE family protein phosphatase n=1 Tax=unclassified Streptomyces TaxID=2593676 RepID=UPI000525D8B7|nr:MULTISPECIES: SpoIIE family protein phosphatase [unclassified Streptomyces]